MKKTLILPECEWILTDEAKNDSRLNPTDKNILAVLQFMFDNKQPFTDGFYAIVLRDSDNVDYTLQKTLNEFGFVVSETTISRSINKLLRFRYIDYKKGFYNNNTHSGQWPKIKILKGTKTLTDCYSDDCSVIACTQKEVQVKEKETSISNYSYSDLQLEVCGNDNSESGTSAGKDTTYMDEVGTACGKAEQPANKLDYILDQLEWCIGSDVFSSDVSFDVAFDRLKKRYIGLDVNYDYLKDMFDRKNKQKRLLA